jgi:signal transduction histidine kinase
VSERGRHRLLGAVGFGVLAIGVLAEWLAHGTRIGFDEQRDLVTGWLIAGAGLAAWAWVPRSRVGPLLVVAGLAWFIGTLGDHVTDIGRSALSLRFIYAGVLAHAIFTWSDGRARRELDRVLVTGGYLVTLLSPLWERDRGLLVIAALFGGGLLVQALTQPARTRRARRPAIVLGMWLAVLLASKGALASLLAEGGVAYPGHPEALWQIALVLVSVGLAGSLIRLERRREAATELVVRLGESGPPTSVAALAEAVGLPDDLDVADALLRAERLGARNAALHDELTAQAHAIEASRRRLVEAADDEREALEARLRHGAGRRLARLEADLDESRAAMEKAPAEAIMRVDRAREQLRLALAELDDLARGLDPALLRERGFGEALGDLALRSPVPVELSLEHIGSQERTLERTLYYVAAEALANVAKHAGATRAWMRLGVDGRAIVLAVEDDGVGGADADRGRGLRGLRDRVEAVGGVLRVAGRPEGGTSLRASIPLDSIAPSG